MHNQVRKLLIITILLFGYVGRSQIVTSFYTDRCTGETKVFTVPMNGQTVISFYDQSRVFSSQEFQNGSLQSWLEGVYLRWTNFGPCSQSQAATTATQQAVQQTATGATQAATQAVAAPVTTPTQTNAPTTVEPPTSTAPTGVTKNTTNETSTTSNKSPVTESDNTATQTSGNDTNSGTSEGNTSTESNSTNDSSSTETGDTNENQGSESTDSESTESTESQEGDSSSSEESDDSSSEGNDTEGESEDSEESTSDEQEEVAEEEESKEEESKEESEESEESEEEKEEESTEETEEEEEEEEKKKKKKQKNTNPPIIVANVSSMENLLGSFDVAMTLGISRSSLRGDKTYALNSMIWSNLKQYMLMVNFSKVFFVKGIPKYVYSTSLMGSRMYSTLTAGNNHSIVRLGKKGSVIGISAGATNIFLNYQISKEGIYLDTSLLSISLTGFYTKSYNFNRFSFSPMVAFSVPLHMQDLYSNLTIENKDITVITGVSGNYALSKRFVLNLGVNVSSNTNKDINSLLSFTIGSRFQF
tara:strand:- start:21 stop:1613 length:1593 start_codon:yes stop_codon:yes gene_type:complete